MDWRLSLARKIVAVSGYFDPCHGGHISYILDAAKYGDVIVILNSDEAAIRKKGYVFMSWDQRAAVVGAIKGVIDVIPVDDSDGTVCSALKKLKPDYYSKGGDRHYENTPEVPLCNKMGIGLIFNCGGPKTASSSELVNKAKVSANETARAWW